VRDRVRVIKAMPAKKAKKTVNIDDEAELGLDDELDEADDIEEGFNDSDDSTSDDEEDEY
jgi:hypothetical protein